jgi:hypothetical protein
VKPTGILVCVPAFGQANCAATTQSLYNLALHLTINGIASSMCFMSAADIAEVRNLFLTTWYDGHHKNLFSHMLFVDADMEFPAQLIADMIKFDKPLMGCLYARRSFPAVAVGRCFNEDQSVDDLKDGFLEVSGVGGGVMMIERQVVTKMIEQMPEIIDTKVDGHPGQEMLGPGGAEKRLIRAFDPFFSDNGLKLSEDLAFCERWKKCGGEVWANVNHLIGHIGPYNYAIRYADYLENKAQAVAA